jgi:acyl-CoA thioesterase-1
MPILFLSALSMAVGPARGTGAERFSYVALGDSLAAGTGARSGGYVERLHQRLRAVHPGATLLNLGVNGATSADVRRDQLPRLARARPSLITLSVGTNDLTRGVPPEQVADDVRRIVTALVATGATVVVTNLPDVALAPAVPSWLRAGIDEPVRRLNSRLAQVAAELRVTLFDLYDLSRRELPGHGEYFSADRFHPSDAGYELFARVMWPVVERALQQR